MAARAKQFDSGIGSKAVSGLGVALLTGYFTAFTALLILALVLFWPAGAKPDPINNFLGSGTTIGADSVMILLVAVLGALGAMAHVVPSFFRYVGERELRWSWVPSYFLIPFVGALLATITFIVLRAGLIGGSTETGNIWGFAAIATLVGLFNAQASSKLKSVFEAIFASPTKGSDQLTKAADKGTTGGTDKNGADKGDADGDQTSGANGDGAGTVGGIVGATSKIATGSGNGHTGTATGATGAGSGTATATIDEDDG